jgi:hypothetical protein
MGMETEDFRSTHLAWLKRFPQSIVGTEIDQLARVKLDCSQNVYKFKAKNPGNYLFQDSYSDIFSSPLPEARLEFFQKLPTGFGAGTPQQVP